MKSALIAAVVAAVVAAASGTAATLVVTSKNIKNGTIQTVDVSAKAKQALKGNRGPQGAAGPAGTAGAQGPPGIQVLQEVVNSEFVPNAQSGQVTATCPPGQQAVSGGFGFTGGVITRSSSTGNGWRVSGFNNSGSSTGLAAWAYCSPNVTVALAPL